jgi:hypothetical protein
MAKLWFEAWVVRAVLAEKTGVVFAVVEQALWGVAFRKVGVALLASPGQEISAGLHRRTPRISKKVVVAVLQLEFGCSLLLDSRIVKEESSILHEWGPLSLMKLCIVALNSEFLDLVFKCWLQTILLPVLLFSISAVGVVSLLGEIFIECLSEVSVEDRWLGMSLELLFKLIFCVHICL